MNFDWNAFRCIVGALTRSTVRRYLHSKAGLIGALFLLLAGTPASLRATRLVGGPHQADLLTGLFLFLTLVPLAGAGAFAEGRSAERLRRFPVSAATRAAGLAVAALLDPPLLLALPPTLALLWRYGPLAGGILTLQLAAAVALGQMLVLMLGAIAERRVVREGAALAVPFVLTGALAIGVAAPTQAAAVVSAARAPMALGAQALPSGMAQVALTAHALPAAAATLALTVWTIGLGAAVVGLTGRTPRSDQRGSRRVRRPRVRLALPGTWGAMVGKELILLRREPALRGGLTQGSVGVAVVLTLTLQPPNVGFQLLPNVGTAAFCYLLVWCLQLLGNLWGADSSARRMLWTFPGSRLPWLVGKNLVYGGVVSALGVAVVTLVARSAGSSPWPFLPPTFAAVALALAMGNLLSALAPFGLVAPSGQSADGRLSGQSFGTGLVYLAVGAVAVTLAIQPFGRLLSVPLYGASLAAGAALLRRRERAVAAALVD